MQRIICAPIRLKWKTSTAGVLLTEIPPTIVVLVFVFVVSAISIMSNQYFGIVFCSCDR